MCAASLVKHRHFVEHTMAPNHVFRLTSAFHRDMAIRSLVENAEDEIVVVLLPWEAANCAFTGIPPHCSVLQQLSMIQEIV